jgi:hypothetical protein
MPHCQFSNTPTTIIGFTNHETTMGEKLQAFGKGGCGCLIAFAILATIGVLVGGHAHIDLGGAICLFVVGGIVGLVVLWIYNKGKHDSTPPAS